MEPSIMTSSTDGLIEAALADPATSDWVKNALRIIQQRDPVDASNDVEFIKQITDKRLADVLASFQSRPAEGVRPVEVQYSVFIECVVNYVPMEYELPAPSHALAESAKALMADALERSAFERWAVKVGEGTFDQCAHANLSKGLLLELHHVVRQLANWLPQISHGETK
jgi:hypothetical protein